MARKVHSDNRIQFQDWLLDHDAVYSDNLRRLVRQPIAEERKEMHGAWLLRSSVGRLRRQGVLSRTV